MKLFILVFLFNLPGFSFGQNLKNEQLSGFSPTENCLVIEGRRASTLYRNVYFELAGSGGFGSFNFEWMFMTRQRNRWAIRTGISGTYIDKNNGAGIISPVMGHFIWGKNHGLDLGIGQALTITTRGNVFLRTPLSLGYRLEPAESRFFYRFSYTPIVSYLVDFQWEHWGGISIGYKLKPKFKLK